MPTKKDLFQPVIKKGVTWYIEYYIDVKGTRKRVRRSRTSDGADLNTITDLTEREMVAKQMVKEIYINLCPPVSSPTQTRFLEALQLAVELKHSNKAKTNKTFAETTRWLGEFFESRGWQNLRCGQLEFEHIQAYFDYTIIKLKIRNSTHNTRKNNLRSLFSELVQRGYLEENFVKRIQDRPVADPLRRPFSQKEQQVLAKYLMENDRPLWLVYLLLGYLAIRPGEIRDLHIRNIDLKKGIVVFSGDQSKNRRNSVVTIPKQIIPHLAAFNLDQYPENYYVLGRAKGRHNRDFLPGPERVGVNTLSNRFRQVLIRLHREGALQHIKGLSLYSLKDTLALYLLENGVDVESAMRHFRHTSLEMFQRYVKRLGVVNEQIRELKVELP
ncbi:MAG: site-specific integrase [Saprospiraceae bacterium]